MKDFRKPGVRNLLDPLPSVTLVSEKTGEERVCHIVTKCRVVAFATHGLLPREAEGVGESPDSTFSANALMST